MKRKAKPKPLQDQPGLKSTTCPHCGKTAMTPAARFSLGFRVSIACQRCGKNVRIPRVAVFYILIAGVLAYGLRSLLEANLGWVLGFGWEALFFVVLLLLAMLLDVRFGTLEAQN